jgi:hypothetical protein
MAYSIAHGVSNSSPWLARCALRRAETLQFYKGNRRPFLAAVHWLAKVAVL